MVKAKRTTTPAEEGIELRPDGWERFEAAVGAATKAEQSPKKPLPKRASPKERTRRRSSHA